MSFFAEIPPLEARVLQDPLARDVLEAVGDMIERLQKVSSMDQINRRMGATSRTLETTTHLLFNAGLLDAKPAGQGKSYTDYTLTAAGWKAIQREQPFWIAPL